MEMRNNFCKTTVYSDITNLMNVEFLTGIQRVVREIIVRMVCQDKLEMHLMVYDNKINAYYLLDNENFQNYFIRHQGKKEDIITNNVVHFTDIPSGTVFFDIDSVWNSRLKRSYLFPLLKQKGVKIVTQLYDLIPITHPQFAYENTAMNFMVYIGANIEYADLIIVSAKATSDALDELCDKLGRPHKKCVVVPLGADFRIGGSDEKPDENVTNLDLDKYILMVGTVEPRKNHSLVVDALEDSLDNMGVKVVIAGRIGWNVAELEQRIKKHPLLGKSLFFLEKPNDATIDYLYKNALAVAFPTFNEGFGLPMIEALCRGTPVIASDIGVLREVGGDFADYFDPYDKKSFAEAVRLLAENEEDFKRKKEQIKSFVPLSWDGSAELFTAAVTSVNENLVQVSDDTEVKQIVVLTARNDDILATLPFLEKYMSFIREIVICCPDKNVNELKDKYKGRLEMKFLTDSEVLNGRELPEDHQTRNFFLRCLILKNEIIDDVFIMTDDDYRPLRNISVQDFITNGRYKAYYCYDLAEWDGTYGDPTSFDIGMKKTCTKMHEMKLPTMMYSSHQPQIIDKNIFNELTQKYPEIMGAGVDEWSTYFNYGVGTYPDKFDVVPYISMCWPGARSDWDLYVEPSEYAFENHYSVLYEDKEVFSGLSDDFEDESPEIVQEKIDRYKAEMKKQLDTRSTYEKYCSDYLKTRKEMPSFTVVCTPEGDNFVINFPEFIRLKENCFTRVHFTFDKDILDKMGASRIRISYWFATVKNEKMIHTYTQEIDNNELSFNLPMRSPVRSDICRFHLTVSLEPNNVQQSIMINAVIV